MPGPAPSGIPEVAWAVDAGAAVSSAPLVVAGIVYFLDGSGIVHAVTLDGGAPCWTAALGTTTTGSPSIVNGQLIVGDHAGTIHAIALSDGSSGWTRALDGGITGAVGISDDVVLAATLAGTAYALDSATGEVRWSTPVGGPVSRSVAVADGTAYLGAGLSVVAISVVDGRIRWATPVSTIGAIGSPSTADGMVFASTGLDEDDPSAHGVTALNAGTGAFVWRFVSPTGATVYTPAVVGGRAYIVGEDRRVVAADAATGDEIWTTTTPEVDEVLAAVMGHQVFIAGNGGAMKALNLDTGEIEWSVPFTGVPYGTTIVDGFVLVGTDAGLLVAIHGG